MSEDHPVRTGEGSLFRACSSKGVSTFTGVLADSMAGRGVRKKWEASGVPSLEAVSMGKLGAG